jgi:hypothetical protein
MKNIQGYDFWWLCIGIVLAFLNMIVYLKYNAENKIWCHWIHVPTNNIIWWQVNLSRPNCGKIYFEWICDNSSYSISSTTCCSVLAKYICIRQKVDVKLSWGGCVFIVIHLGNYGILSWLPPAPCLISLSCLALRMFFNLYVFVICSMYCISTEQHVVEEMLYELLSPNTYIFSYRVC